MALYGDRKREYDRAWMKARREKYFVNKTCTECGSNKNLELDHIVPADKLFNPAALWGMSDANPNKIAELAKCQVLCCECHKLKTEKDMFEILATTSKTLICSRGHDMNIVGFYARGKYKQTKACKLCQLNIDHNRKR